MTNDRWFHFCVRLGRRLLALAPLSPPRSRENAPYFLGKNREPGRRSRHLAPFAFPNPRNHNLRKFVADLPECLLAHRPLRPGFQCRMHTSLAKNFRPQSLQILRHVGYEAVKHQRFVGTGYFDAVQQVITSGTASTMALQGSTEEAQFTHGVARNVEPVNGHAITTPWTLADPMPADPVLMAACFEASDELMPSGD